MKLRKLLLCLLASFTLTGCFQTNISSVIKCSKDDPYEKSIVKSQFFNISGNIDNIIEGEEGTLVIFPKGCFIRSNGSPVIENVEIELAEALSLDQILLSNLTTTSNGKPLETDGMIYLNATTENKQLSINPEIPIYVEIPTDEVKSGMMVYKGIRDESGNMNWVQPKKLENSLVAIDIFSLNLLPRGFEEEVEKGLPFRDFRQATPQVIDSLYYYGNAYINDVIEKKRLSATENEGFYYSILTSDEVDSMVPESEESDILINNDIQDTLYATYGVDPLKIKALKSEKFQNTLIATREFEKRLQVMFKICRPDILDIYINNLDKNLWELDSLAATILKGDKHEDAFLGFSKERKTKIRGADKNVQILSKYYKQRLKQIKTESRKIFEELEQSRKIEEKKKQKIREAYREILKKREKHRMETYGFQQTELGWLNIDRGAGEKDWESQRLEVLVKNGDFYDRVHTYIFYKSIKSLFRLNSLDSKTFFVGNENSREMLIPKRKPAVIASIAYLDDEVYSSFFEFETNSTKEIEINLNKTEKKKLDEILGEFDTNGVENSISSDLEFMEQLSMNRKTKNRLDAELGFLYRLYKRSFPMDITIAFDTKYQIELAACDPSPDEIIEETVPEDDVIN
ncbi:hypothetical protein [Flagellimonas sp.]|uniref:hypothetical protein n=1 Tax=Flagellimonas sp. TaxID=2058762 RepID=UPI003B590F90